MVHPELSGCITTLTVANFCAAMDTLIDQDAGGYDLQIGQFRSGYLVDSGLGWGGRADEVVISPREAMVEYVDIKAKVIYLYPYYI